MAFQRLTKTSSRNTLLTACLVAMAIAVTGINGCRGKSPKEPVNKTNQPSQTNQFDETKNAKLNSPNLAPAIKPEVKPTLVKPVPSKTMKGNDDVPMVPPRILYDTMHLRHEIRHRGPLDLHPDFGRFLSNQYRKDHTLFVLAFDSVTRQNYFLNNYLYLVSDEQRLQAMALVESFDDRFRVLLEQRNEIMEVASDQLDVQGLLVNNKVETLKMSRLLRRSIHREVLTQAQRAKFKADFEEEQRDRKEVQAKQTAKSKQP